MAFLSISIALRRSEGLRHLIAVKYSAGMMPISNVNVDDEPCLLFKREGVGAIGANVDTDERVVVVAGEEVVLS